MTIFDFDVRIPSRLLCNVLNDCLRDDDNKDSEINGVIIHPKTKLINGDYVTQGLSLVISMKRNIALPADENGGWYTWPTNSYDFSYESESSDEAIEQSIKFNSGEAIFSRERFSDDKQVELFEDTREFDLVFCGINDFLYAAGIVFSKQYEVRPEAYKYYPSKMDTPAKENMMLQISRALIDIDVPLTLTGAVGGGRETQYLGLKKYRTLKLNPYIDPQTVEINNDSAIAYVLGIPCPPTWREEFYLPELFIPKAYVSGLFKNPNLPYRPTLMDRARAYPWTTASAITSAASIGYFAVKALSALL